MLECKAEQDELGTKLKANRARQRYLDHLAQDSMDEDEEEGCILCKCEFIRGFITQWFRPFPTSSDESYILQCPCFLRRMYASLAEEEGRQMLSSVPSAN